MSYSFPHFKSGNTSFANALNSVVAVIRKHGVNPGGRSGWAETENGWLPPYISATGGADIESAWDLIAGVEPETWKVRVGTILRGDDSVSDALTCSNPADEFTLIEGDIVAIKIESEDPTEFSIVTVNLWPEDAGAAVSYTGTVADGDFEMTERHYPLWQVKVSPVNEPSIAVGEGIVAVRIAPRENLAIVKRLYRTDTGELVTLPSFAVSHRAITL